MRIETSAHHTKRQRVNKQAESVRLPLLKRRYSQLCREGRVRLASTTPPRRDQHRRPAARVQTLHCLMLQGHPYADAESSSEFFRSGLRAGVGGLTGERPLGISVRQSTHSRRMRYIHCFALLTLEHAGSTQQDVGEANGLRVHTEFGSQFGPGWQWVARLPFPGGDAAADVSSDAPVARSLLWHQDPYRRPWRGVRSYGSASELDISSLWRMSLSSEE